MELRDVRFQQDRDGYLMELCMEAEGCSVFLSERRGRGRSRSTRYSGELADGGGFRPTEPRKPSGLFASDLSLFLRQLAGGPGHCTPGEAIAILAMAEKCSERCL